MHPRNKLQRQLSSAKEPNAKVKKDRSGHIKRKLAVQAVKEQEIEHEIREALSPRGEEDYVKGVG